MAMLNNQMAEDLVAVDGFQATNIEMALQIPAGGGWMGPLKNFRNGRLMGPML